MVSTNKISDAYVISVIGEGSTFRGDLDLQGVLHINGDFYGSISTVGDVAIGLSGRAQCKIAARNVVISGSIQGRINATSSVHLNNSAVVIGDIQTTSLTIEPQAIVHGKITTRKLVNQQPLLAAKSPNDDSQTAKVFDAWQK